MLVFAGTAEYNKSAAWLKPEQRLYNKLPD